MSPDFLRCVTLSLSVSYTFPCCVAHSPSLCRTLSYTIMRCFTFFVGAARNVSRCVAQFPSMCRTVSLDVSHTLPHCVAHPPSLCHPLPHCVTYPSSTYGCGNSLCYVPLPMSHTLKLHSFALAYQCVVWARSPPFFLPGSRFVQYSMATP